MPKPRRVRQDCPRPLVPARILERLGATDNPEAYAYATGKRPDGGNGVWIVGKTDIATLYGTYAFLEDYIGFRYFHAGPSGRRKSAGVPPGASNHTV